MAKKTIGMDELKKVNDAFEQQKDTNANYHKCMSFAYESVLTEKDLKSLQNQEVSTFEINSLKPYINPQIKQLCDSSPNIRFTSDVSDYNQELLNAYFDKVKKQSQYDTQLFKGVRSSIIGGFGVLKAKTEYCDDDSFMQDIFLYAVNNPTCVYFDPSAKNAAKTDAKWVFELKKISKEEFINEYTKEKYNSIKKSAKALKNSSVKWIEAESSQKETLTVCEYYYYKNTAKYLSLDPDMTMPGGMTSRVYLKKSDVPADSIKSRKIFDRKVMKKVFCADVLLEEPAKSNFKQLPYAYICGDSYVDKDGNEKATSFIECAIDPLRMKTIALNLFFDNLANRIDGTFIYDINSTPDDVVKDLSIRGIKKRSYGYFSSYVDDIGQQHAGTAPQYISPPPISSEELQMMQVLDVQIEKILGTTSANPDVEHSGAYLTKLSDYISASAEPFLQSFIEALQWIGKVILHTLPSLHYGSYSFKDDNGNTYMLPDDFDPNSCNVNVNRSLSTKLLKQESLKQLSAFSTPNSALGGFLSSPIGGKYILNQLDIVDKDRMEQEYNNFILSQKNQQAQSAKQPNPEMIEAHAKVVDAQAKQINAQANVMDAQAKQEEAHINAGLNTLKAHTDMRKIISDEIFSIFEYMQKEKAINAENLKTLLGA